MRSEQVARRPHWAIRERNRISTDARQRERIALQAGAPCVEHDQGGLDLDLQRCRPRGSGVAAAGRVWANAAGAAFVTIATAPACVLQCNSRSLPFCSRLYRNDVVRRSVLAGYRSRKLTTALARRLNRDRKRSSRESFAIASPDSTVLNGSTFADSGFALTSAGTRPRGVHHLGVHRLLHPHNPNPPQRQWWFAWVGPRDSAHLIPSGRCLRQLSPSHRAVDYLLPRLTSLPLHPWPRLIPASD